MNGWEGGTCGIKTLVTMMPGVPVYIMYSICTYIEREREKEKERDAEEKMKTEGRERERQRERERARDSDQKWCSCSEHFRFFLLQFF